MQQPRWCYPAAPRARGDGPEMRLETGEHEICSPSAGMDPREETSLPCWNAAPSRRGDGPPVVFGFDGKPICSPHARGWNRDEPDAVYVPGLLPAPAGMDPTRSAKRARKATAPRACGDVPRASNPVGQDQLPRAAGLDAGPAATPGNLPTASRLRGDGPFVRPALAVSKRCSPLGRGWTLPDARDGRCTALFPPARERTHLLAAAGGPRPLLLARAAGMDPAPSTWPPSTCTLPACAGIDPASTSSGSCAPAAPRPRGDEPSGNFVGARNVPCSSPAPGWTQAGYDGAGDRCLLPARARMNPRPFSTIRRWTAAPAPRPRGDGPWYFEPNAQEIVYFPLAAGWTREGPLARRPGRVLSVGRGTEPTMCGPSNRTAVARRQRGDGPGTGNIGGELNSCSPRAAMDLPRPARSGPSRRCSPPVRMCTRRESGQVDVDRLLPNCVGMDSTRARGVQPDILLPARLGVDLQEGRAHRRGRSAPRPRGWTPCRARRPRRPGLSPHSQGWTQAGRVQPRRPELLPARAGMDPAWRLIRPPTAVAPCPRGKGPRASTMRRSAGRCFPPARVSATL
ncbi:hypothetical protein M2266_006010 [Streptomyces sp. SPB162]|nr:hypothetical protein [Streptomyces sp. SPB162]